MFKQRGLFDFLEGTGNKSVGKCFKILCLQLSTEKKCLTCVKACSLHRLARYGGSACNPKHWRGQSINAVNFEASLAYIRSSGSRELRLEWELTLRRWAHATLGRPHIHTLKGLSPLCVSMCRCNQLWLVDGVLYTLQPFHKQTNTCKETTVVNYLNKDSGHSKFQIWWKSSTDKKATTNCTQSKYI